MSNLELNNNTHILGIIKKWECLFLLITFILFLSSLIQKNLILNQFLKDRPFASEIFYAFLTAFLITILTNIFSRYKQKKENEVYLGCWSILKFNGTEDYVNEGDYVIISESSKTFTLNYFQENTESLNTKQGKIYINSNNTDMGELIISYKLLNLAETIYPINSYRILFDKKHNSTGVISPIIRIINSSFKEEFILYKPLNQVSFIQDIEMKKHNSIKFYSSDKPLI